jgi:hypothetical protein
MLISVLWTVGLKTTDMTRQENQLQVTEKQQIETQKGTLNSTPHKQNKVMDPKVSTVKKENLPPVLPTEKQAAGITPTENSAEMSFQPEPSTAALTAPYSASVAEQAPGSPIKQIQETPTIVASAFKKELKTKPLDNTGGAAPKQNTIPAQELSGTSPSLINEKFQPPEYLGDIVTAPGENIGDMIRRIYGPWSFNPENLKIVLAANKNLKSPELLQVGQKIRFPTIPVNLTSQAEKAWWVRITTLDNIQSAYRFLRKHRNLPSPLLIIPSRGDSDKVLLNILLEEYFMDKKSAQQAIQYLPGEIKKQAETLHGLDPGIFYYQVKQKD